MFSKFIIFQDTCPQSVSLIFTTIFVKWAMPSKTKRFSLFQTLKLILLAWSAQYWRRRRWPNKISQVSWGREEEGKGATAKKCKNLVCNHHFLNVFSTKLFLLELWLQTFRMTYHQKKANYFHTKILFIITIILH